MVKVKSKKDFSLQWCVCVCIWGNRCMGSPSSRLSSTSFRCHWKCHRICSMCIYRKYQKHIQVMFLSLFPFFIYPCLCFCCISVWPHEDSFKQLIGWWSNNLIYVYHEHKPGVHLKKTETQDVTTILVRKITQTLNIMNTPVIVFQLNVFKARQPHFYIECLMRNIKWC